MRNTSFIQNQKRMSKYEIVTICFSDRLVSIIIQTNTKYTYIMENINRIMMYAYAGRFPLQVSLLQLVILCATSTLISSFTVPSAVPIVQLLRVSSSGSCGSKISTKTREKEILSSSIITLYAEEGSNDSTTTTTTVFEVEGVVELGVAKTTKESQQDDNNNGSIMAPFISQGNEIDPQALNPDMSDPKQLRVIIYMILSLLPVLFLIPLMIGSRDLIPLDSVPPVQL